MVQRGLRGGRGRFLGSRGAVALLALLALAGVGCADSTDDVTLTGPTVPRLEEIATIGCSECEGVEQLTTQGVSVGGGRVFLLDAHEPLVRVFTVEGEPVAAFGRQGEGPGELLLGVAVYAAEGDRVLVHDIPAIREYSITGDYIRSMSWSPRLPNGLDFRASDRSLYMIARAPPFGGAAGLPAGWTLLRWQANADQLEPEVLIEEADLPHYREDESERGRLSVVALADGGFLLGEAWGYDLYRYAADGTLLQQFGRRIDRPLRTGKDLEAARAMNDQFRAQGLEPAFPDEEAPHFAVFGLQVDGQGRLWARTLRGADDTTLFDVFDASGEFLGEVSVAGRIGTSYPVWDLDGDHIAGAVSGPDGNPVVKVWRIAQ